MSTAPLTSCADSSWSTAIRELNTQVKTRPYRITLKQRSISVGNDDAQKHLPIQGGLGSCLVHWYTINSTSPRTGEINQDRTHRSCMRSFTDA